MKTELKIGIVYEKYCILNFIIQIRNKCKANESVGCAGSHISDTFSVSKLHNLTVLKNVFHK
jgi:hypothetical protein